MTDNFGKILIGLFSLLFVVVRCDSRFNSELSDYYFPIEYLYEPKVYVYASQLNKNHPDEIWLYSTDKKNGEWIFNSKNYRSDLRLVQDQNEIIVENGALLKSLRLISYDSLNTSTSSHAIIHHANLFPFELDDSTDILLYKIQFVDEYEIDSASQKRITTLTRNRIFDEFSNYSFEYEVLPAIIFNVKESIESEEKGLIEIRFDMAEIYAKHVGRIAYTKTLDGEVVFDYKLKKIYSLDKFEKEIGILIND